MKNTKIITIDDDNTTLALIEGFVKGAGYEVLATGPSNANIEFIKEEKPDIIILDIIMPGIDGLEFAGRIKDNPETNRIKIIVLTSKNFAQDKRAAEKIGVDYFLLKPTTKELLLETIDKLLNKTIEIDFWGVRGTLPVTGKNSLKYGGNTSCVTVTLPNSELFVFDSGSGIKNMSQAMMRNKDDREINLFISHAHWDHINAFPFISQLYISGQSVNVYGPKNRDISVKQMLIGQMDSIYFPVTADEFKANVSYVDLREEQLQVGAATIKTLLLNHPGNCLGYRLEYGGTSICYITDNEIPFETDPHYSQNEIDRLTKFIQNSDVLITDTTYFDEEYLDGKVGWGHSSVSRVVDIAHAAQVKNLYLFHHDPDQLDSDIERKYSLAKQRLLDLESSTVCKEAVEKFPVRISAEAIRS